MLTIKKYSRAEENYQLSLLGSHQARNAALAVRAVEELAAEFPVEKKEIKKALKNVYWPGRMQKISEKPLTIVDAAHNPAAFRELSSNLYNYRNEYNNIHFIFSILSDKDLDGILKELLKLKNKLKLYLAENSSFRTIKLDLLEEKVESQNFNYQSFNNLSEASRSAQNKAAEGDLIVAAGSFNTVFEAGIEIMSKQFRGGEDE
jgi:dihydrofolate synthase/folylpolyglutamate synthase